MAQAALTIDGLGVDFEGFKAVNQVTMIVDEGELRVLLGANGAGKTTLMDLISGKTKSTSGRVFLYDTDITNWEEHKIARAGVGRKFQIPSVFKELTVRRNLEVASCRNPGVFANLRFGFSADAKQNVDEVLEMIGLTEQADQVAAYLSHGQTQWLELGLLITQNPKIILLDEPTAGMTQAETHKTSLIVNNLKGRHTIIVVEHDMAFVREIAERITVLHLGQVLAEGNVEEIENNPRVREAYLGSKGISLMLALAHVDSFYDRSHILHDVCLDVPEGKVTAVLGRNGTGKTTLLKTLMGLTDRMDGEIRLDADRSRQAADLPPGARRHCLCAAGTRDHSGFLDPRKHPDGLVCPRRRQARDPEARRRAVSLSDGESRPQWRRALRRPAAAARDRARARGRPEDHPARRAERGNPALDRRGNRERHHPAQPGHRPDRRPRRAECIVRSPCRASLRHDGEGAGCGGGRDWRPQRRDGSPSHGGMNAEASRS